MLADIKDTDPRKFSLEDAVGLLFYLEGCQERFTALGIDPPDWLAAKVRVLHRHIDCLAGDELERKLKVVKRDLEALKSEDEKRSDLEAEIKALEKKLGI